MARSSLFSRPVGVSTCTEISRPTDIQARAIPPLLAGHDVLMAGQTGTGKTLAYLLPLIQKLKHDEDRGGIVVRPSRPRIIIVAPTRELAQQVGRVSKALSHRARYRSVCLVDDASAQFSKRGTLDGPIDVCISTPARLLGLVVQSSPIVGWQADVEWNGHAEGKKVAIRVTIASIFCECCVCLHRMMAS